MSEVSREREKPESFIRGGGGCWVFFSVVFLLQAVIFRCWPVKNSGRWRISGGDTFKVKSFILGWIFSNKNYLGAVLNEAVQFVFSQYVACTRRQFKSFVLCACGLQLFSLVSESVDISL